MALNKYMHPRNPYKHKRPSFKDFARKYDFFKDVSEEDDEGRVTIDFKTPAHLAALSKAILLNDFGLSVEFPLDRLVPTIPLRLNYILWLEDIIKGFSRQSPNTNVLDIGVGASCIYPLLGAKKNSWNFYGTEVDKRNYASAQENVERNKLQNLVKVIHIQEDASSLNAVFEPAAESGLDSPPAHLDAVMANPPFYCDTSDAVGTKTSRSVTRPTPKTCSSAARHESQTRGGEVYYCMRLAKDSVKYATRVGVFTVMLGKKSSVVPMKRILRKLKVPNVSVYELCQGRIMRWGLAWTFLPSLEFPESEFHRLRKLEKPPLSYTLPPTVACLSEYTVECLFDWLRNEFKLLKMKVLDQKNRATLGGYHLAISATENTWTHARRKRREAERAQAHGQKPQSSGAENGVSAPPTPDKVAPDDHTPTPCPPSSMKRPHESDDVDMMAEERREPQVESTAPTDLPTAIKRARTQEVCEEGDAWEDDYQNLACCPEEPPKCGYLVQADVFVEQLAEDTKDSTDTAVDEEALIGESLACGPLVIKIAFTGGSCREAANQILCYLKNRLK